MGKKEKRSISVRQQKIHLRIKWWSALLCMSPNKAVSFPILTFLFPFLRLSVFFFKKTFDERRLKVMTAFVFDDIGKINYNFDRSLSLEVNGKMKWMIRFFSCCLRNNLQNILRNICEFFFAYILKRRIPPLLWNSISLKSKLLKKMNSLLKNFYGIKVTFLLID